MKKPISTWAAAGLGALALVACGDDVGDVAAQMLGDAGEVLADAGEALADAAVQMTVDAGQAAQDAGHALTDAAEVLRDANTADAQALPAADSGTVQPARPRTQDQTCDVVRSYRNSSGQTFTQRFARITVPVESVRTVWLCDTPTQPVMDCTGTTSCTVQPPKVACTQTLPLLADDGTLWVQCGATSSVKLILD